MFRTFLLVSALFSVAFACTCMPGPPNPEKQFCRSDAVGVFRILKRVPGNDTAFILSHYAAPTLVFKSVAGKDGSASQPNPEFLTVIETNSHSAACGLTWLQEGKEYLLNGAYDNERRTLHIGICGQIAATQWSNVPADIKKALEDGAYKCSQ